jgi:hypothetical protein
MVQREKSRWTERRIWDFVYVWKKTRLEGEKERERERERENDLVMIVSRRFTTSLVQWSFESFVN